MFMNMKNLRIFIPVLAIAAILMSLASGCDDMNSINQKYYDQGERIYTGVVDSIKVFPGYEKVEFSWLINADPRITKVVLYWNQRADSVVVPVQREVYKVDTMVYRIESIPEGNYIFEFLTRDDDGHKSLTKETSVTVYGEEYCSTLMNRSVISISKQADGSVLIEWGYVPSENIQYTIVEYPVDGGTDTVHVSNSSSSTVISGPNTGDEIKVSSVYLMENALEEIAAGSRTYTVPRYSALIEKSLFSVLVLPGDNTTTSNNRPLANIWDGSASRILHTQDNAPGFSFPHHFSFDITKPAEILSFTLWPRGDASPFTGHSPASYELWAAAELHDVTDTTYYTSDSWKADWVQLVSYTVSKPSTSEAQKSEWAAGWTSTVDKEGERFRYFRLVVTSNWQGSNCVNIGEISLVGDNL